MRAVFSLHKKVGARTKPKESTIKNVLVGVLKNRNDLSILFGKRWYRIPTEYFPRRKFEYVAFYQTGIFGKKGKRIEYYARVLKKRRLKRINLLPKEIDHPRANEDYIKIEFSKIIKLSKAIRNIIPRRISFGFTDLKTLRSANDILELYGIPPTEQLVEKKLSGIGIKTVKEFTVTGNGKKYRIDFAIFRKNGKIAVECDNYKAHRSKTQIVKDKKKDSFLVRHGWHVIRLKERNILENIDHCMNRIKKIIQAIDKPFLRKCSQKPKLS